MISNRDKSSFIEDVFDSNLLENAVDWISSNLEPNDVFSEKQLADWARYNGFVEEE